MNPGTPTPPPPAPPAPQKRKPLVRLTIGCGALLLVGCVGVAGLAFYENWQQERNYQAGHQAYARADCEAARDPLQKAASGEPGTSGSDVALKAEAELQECEALIAADELDRQGQLGDALVAYSTMAEKYPSSPLQPVALERAQAIGAESAPADLASAGSCGSVDSLLDQGLVAADAATLPALLYACGQLYEADEAFGDALIFYDRVLDQFPDHSLAGEVEQALARAAIGEANALGAGGLPAPQAVGSGSAGGQVTVVIRNDSPEGLRLVFSGPEVRVEELGPCESCEEFTSGGPSGCPEQGPVGEYLLAPGDYDVVVKALSGSVTPFRGSWTLESGQEYNSCFYLVTSES